MTAFPYCEVTKKGASIKKGASGASLGGTFLRHLTILFVCLLIYPMIFGRVFAIFKNRDQPFLYLEGAASILEGAASILWRGPFSIYGGDRFPDCYHLY